MQTRDQKYACDVYKRVKEIADDVAAKKRTEKFSKTYGSMAHKLPILIRTSGLAQALAFVNSRGKGKGSERLLDDLSQTVLDEEDLSQAVPDEPAAMLLRLSRGEGQASNLRKYIHLTERTLAALLWYKRYAQSILNVEQGDENDEDADDR